ncbi:disease resistance protein RPM1-like [Quercus robur]|uniref:disease resistance protein RPM1-like n=1 Tax=Quercus robur TaxID=38942 RepID=UPI00216217C5|nr:disease resistance protein RPM1-like [Quercus robur]
MAETVVSSLIDRMVTLLDLEAKLLGGIRGEVADIKDELESIQSFLKDADARAAAEQDIGEGVKTWVKQVRDVAFHIDIAIDQYLAQVALHDPHRRGFRGFLQKTTHLLKTIIPRHKIATKIQEIKASVQKINERSKRYCFQSKDQGSCSEARSISWNDPRKDSLYLDDADVVGIESPKHELIAWLVEGSPHRTVVSVVGMGGLGKTTLTKKVYDHQRVRGHFDCHAWISVSQSYKIEDLLRSIIKQFCKDREELPLLGIDAMDEQLLVNKLRDYLQQKRYVVVFDDVWNIDFWDSIKNSLLDNHLGGRIMITTRNSEVADFCKKSSHVLVYKLQPLPWDEAWELFCKRAFQFDFEGHCPAILEKLSHDIVEKCGGLPLAIVAISGLLSTKDKTLFEWKNLHDSLGFEFGRNPHLSSVNKILSLSFEDLPYNLKSCFLYLGMYPEDYSINCIRLIRQWIAEGFVKEVNGKTLEEVAHEYLIELIHRSLVQVSKVNFDGKFRRCQLHDLLHEIVLQKMKDLSFCHVLLKQESSFEVLIRRMSVNKVSYNVLKGFKDNKIHSLLLFNLDELPKSFMSPFFADFKFLKVMDFEDAPLDHIPKDVGSLFHLKYLSLRNTKVKKLPKSIGKLQNLETLDLKHSLVCDIPVEINKLRKLRHLIAYYCNNQIDFSLAWRKAVKIQKGVGCLAELQKMYYVDLSCGGIDLIKDMGKLRQLRKLGVSKLSKETMRAFCASIAMMNHLQSLDIATISEDEIIDLQSISTSPQCLQRLYICGHLEKLPDWIQKLQHLVRLRIFWSKLNEDPLKALQNLPNLLELGISGNAYNGKQLHFKIGGFPKLKILKLLHLHELHSLMIDDGAVPLLKFLHIGPSPQLNEVPSGIQHLRNLKELEFRDMPKEFEESLDPEQGPRYWIIKHVPNIYLSHKVRIGYHCHEFHSLRSEHLIGSQGQKINQNDDNNENDSINMNA